VKELWESVLVELTDMYSKHGRLSGAIMRLRISDEIVNYDFAGNFKSEDDRLKQATAWVERLSRKHQRQYSECVFAMDIEGEVRLDYHNSGSRYGMILGIPKHPNGEFRLDDIIGKDQDVSVDCLANLNYRLE